MSHNLLTHSCRHHSSHVVSYELFLFRLLALESLDHYLPHRHSDLMSFAYWLIYRMEASQCAQLGNSKSRLFVIPPSIHQEIFRGMNEPNREQLASYRKEVRLVLSPRL
jgi:hypothetical protein